MLFYSELTCCNKVIKNGELWILKDFNGFVQRKLLKAICPICGDEVCLLIQTSTKNGNTYFDDFTHLEAVKTLYREKKRIVTVIADIQADKLYGWVYGINTQIKNKKGNVTQIRQYASNFQGERKLVKQMYC